MNFQDKCIPGSFSRVPGDCGSYYTCLWGRHERFECAPGLHFSEESRICDWPSRAKCPNVEQQTARPSIATQSPTWELPVTQGHITSEKPWTAHPTTERHTTTYKPWMQDPTVETHTTTHKPWMQDPTVQTDTTTYKPWSQSPTTHVPTKKPTTQNPWIWTEKPKPLPPPLIDPNKVSPLSGHFKVQFFNFKYIFSISIHFSILNTFLQF